MAPAPSAEQTQPASSYRTRGLRFLVIASVAAARAAGKCDAFIANEKLAFGRTNGTKGVSGTYPDFYRSGRLQSLSVVLFAADALAGAAGRSRSSIAEFFRALGATEFGKSVAHYSYAFDHEALLQNVGPYVDRADALAQSTERLTTIVDVVTEIRDDVQVASAFTHPEIQLDGMLRWLGGLPTIAIHARNEIEAMFRTCWRVEIRYSSGQRGAQYFQSQKQAERVQQGFRPGPDEFGMLGTTMEAGGAGEIVERTLYAPGER